MLLGSTSLAALRHRFAAFGIFLLAAMTPLAQAVLHVLPNDRGLNFRVAGTGDGDRLGARLSPPGLGQLWRASASTTASRCCPQSDRGLDARCRRSRRPSAAPRRAQGAVAHADAFGSSQRRRLRLPLLALPPYVGDARDTEQLRHDEDGHGSVAFLPFFLLGAVLARGSRWRFLALGAVPVLWSTQWIPSVVAGTVHGPSMNDVHDALPFIAVVAAGVLWRPIAAVAGGERTRAWVLVVALNALDVADVLFTKAALHSGQAVEANPFAAWIGPGIKLIGVGLASIGLRLPPPRPDLARAGVRRPHRLAPQRPRPRHELKRLRPTRCV